MSTKKKSCGRRKLSREILELMLIGLAVSVFFFGFLYFTSMSIADSYLYGKNIWLSQIQHHTLKVWLGSLCFFASVVVFLTLFLSLAGQKISYLLSIIKGVDSLRKNSQGPEIPLEGDDELTELASSINYLYQSQKELNRREQQMREEREALIRSLSHDIRTPLTSILSYSDYLKAKESLDEQEISNYIAMVQTKAEQIRLLTERLLGKKEENRERVENGKFLMEQLAAEWEEILEEKFICQVNLEKCGEFQGIFDISQLRRIFDNLASNVGKYADPSRKAELWISSEDGMVWIYQKNGIRQEELCQAESYGIGLDSIRRIAKDYQGNLEIKQEDDVFEITISLKMVPGGAEMPGHDI